MHIYQYYCNQLRLFCWLVKERNYYSIEKIEKILPFELLLSAVINRNLTYEVRGLCTELINHIYLNRQPHHTTTLPIYTRGFLPKARVSSIGDVPAFNASHQILAESIHSKNESAQREGEDEDTTKFAVLQAFVNQHFIVGTRDIDDNDDDGTQDEDDDAIDDAIQCTEKPMHNKVVKKGFEDLQIGEVAALMREAYPDMHPALVGKLSQVTGYELIADDGGIVPLNDKDKLRKLIGADLLQVRKLQTCLTKIISACKQKKEAAAQFTTQVSLLASNLIAFGFYDQQKIEDLAVPIVKKLEQLVASLIPDSNEERKKKPMPQSQARPQPKKNRNMAQVHPHPQESTESESSSTELESETQNSRLLFRCIFGCRTLITNPTKRYAFLDSLPYNIFITIIVVLSIVFGVVDCVIVYARYLDQSMATLDFLKSSVNSQKVSSSHGARYFALFQILLLAFVGAVLVDFILRKIGQTRPLDCSRVVETVSAILDAILMVILLSYTYEPPGARSLPSVTMLIIATIARCVLVYRLYSAWPSKKHSGDSKIGPVLHQVDSVFKNRFDRVWFTQHMDVQDRATIFTPFGAGTHYTKCIRLQLKLLHRISLLKQEQVFHDIIYTLTIIENGQVRIKPDSSPTDPNSGELVKTRVKQHFLATNEFDKYAKLYHKSSDYMLGCLLSLCLYPDTEVVSQAMSLLTTLHSKTQNLLKIAKRTRIISTSKVYKPFRYLGQKNQDLRNLAESFETWGRLYNAQCESSFEKVIGILEEITLAMTRYSADRNSLDELKHSFLECDSPDTARDLLLLARDWYGNMSLTGGIQSVYMYVDQPASGEETKTNKSPAPMSLEHTIYLDNDAGLHVAQGEALMLRMLETVCNLLTVVATDYLPAQKRIFDILPLLVPLFPRVPSATEVIKAVLQNNSHGVTSLSDHFVKSLVISLRMMPPPGLLDFNAIDVREVLPSWSKSAGWDDKAPDLFRTEELYPDDTVYHTLVEDIIEILRIIMFNPDPIQSNQVRIVKFLSLHEERLKKEISLHLLKGSEYQKFTQASNWRNNRLVQYHLGMFKLMAHGCVGSINITEAKCLTIVDLDYLLECAADEDIIWPIRTYLLLLLYHMAIDAEIKVRYLCHKPGAKKLLKHFGEVMMRVQKFLEGPQNREVFIRMLISGELPTVTLSRCEMLFLDPASKSQEDPPIKQVGS